MYTRTKFTKSKNPFKEIKTNEIEENKGNRKLLILNLKFRDCKFEHNSSFS
jgi:hypothetical protein